MTGPSWPECPECFSEAVEVLHEQSPEADTTHATLKCEACGRVFKGVLEEPSEVEVRCVISKGAESTSVQIEVPAEGRFQVGDEIYGADQRLLITSIENTEAQRVQSASVPEINTIWAKNFDTVVVDVAVNKGHITHADEMEVVPEEEFFIGDEITIHNQPVRVKAIKTEDRILRHRGSAQAREIVRIFTERTDWKQEQEAKQTEEEASGSRGRRGGRGGQR